MYNLESYTIFNQAWYKLLAHDPMGLKPLNEERETDLSKKHKYVYTIDKPDFALLISLVLNHETYSNQYGNEFMVALLFMLDQEGLTGEFGTIGGVHLKTDYPAVFGILKNKFHGKKLAGKYISYHAISNSSIKIIFEEKSGNNAGRTRKKNLQRKKLLRKRLQRKRTHRK